MSDSASIVPFSTARRNHAARFLQAYSDGRQQILDEQEARIQELLELPFTTRLAYFELLEQGWRDVFPPTVQQLLREALL